MAHQLGRGLKVPIGIRALGVPPISGQRQRVTHHVIGRTMAVFQRPHGKAVTQIVYPRLGCARILLQLERLDQRAERPVDHGITEWPAGV